MSEEEDIRYWVYAGGLPFELTEGDIVCVFSQFGEVTEMTLSRDRETGKSRGFGFIKYEDPRSCEMAVDNFNGTTIVGRRIKVSFASNSQALRNRKPTNIAPQEGSTLPIVESHKRQHSASPSPQPHSMLRRSRSPVDGRRDKHDRTRFRQNYRVSELNYSDDRKRRSPIDRRGYRDSDEYNQRDRRDGNYNRDRRTSDYASRDNRNGDYIGRDHRQLDLRYRDRDTDRSHHEDSSSGQRRRDSRDRSDQYRSRNRRDDYNGDRTHHRNLSHSDHSHQSKDHRRSNRRSRSRSIDRSPPPRSPNQRRHNHDSRDQYHNWDRRHRTRYDSGDRKAYN